MVEILSLKEHVLWNPCFRKIFSSCFVFLKWKSFKVISDSWRRSLIFLFSSDIWALGCVLYEMCTLKHAVSRSLWNILQIMWKIPIIFVKKNHLPSFRWPTCTRNYSSLLVCEFLSIFWDVNVNQFSLSIYAYVKYACYIYCYNIIYHTSL